MRRLIACNPAFNHRPLRKAGPTERHNAAPPTDRKCAPDVIMHSTVSDGGWRSEWSIKNVFVNAVG